MLPMLPMLPTLPPPPKHRESPPAPPVGVGRARCGGGDASSPSPRHRLPPPNPPSRPPPNSDAARATVALDCYCAAGGVTVYSHGRRDRRTRTAGSTGSPHSPTPGGPRGGGGGGGAAGGSRRGRPASRGSRSSHAGCSSPHINSYCSGGRAPSGSSSGSGIGGDPPAPRIPHPAPAPQPLTCPPGGDTEPLGDRPRRARPLGSRGPVPPCRVPPPGGTAGRSRSGAGGGAGAAGTERGRRGRGGGGRRRSQVAQPARRGQEIPERRSQSGPACPGTGHRAFSSRRRPVLAGQGSS